MGSGPQPRRSRTCIKGALQRQVRRHHRGYRKLLPRRGSRESPKGGYPRTREGLSLLLRRRRLSLLLRIFRRHQHPPLGCQPRSPECSTQVRSPLYVHVGSSGLRGLPQPDSPPGIFHKTHHAQKSQKLHTECKSTTTFINKSYLTSYIHST